MCRNLIIQFCIKMMKLKMLILECSVIFSLLQLPLWEGETSLNSASLRASFFPVSCSSSPLVWLITRHLPHSNNFFSLTNCALLLYQLLAHSPTPQHLLFPTIFHLTFSSSSSQGFPEFQFWFLGLLVLISTLCQPNSFSCFQIPAGGIIRTSNKTKPTQQNSPCSGFVSMPAPQEQMLLFWVLCSKQFNSQNFGFY